MRVRWPWRASAARSANALVAALVARARAAQRAYETWPQERVDEAVAAAGWAIVEPSRNRELAELAVRDTGMGNVEDKIAKNRRKTLGLLRDLRGAKSVGVIAEDRRQGLDRDRAARRRRRGDHPVDQSGGDARQQHPERAQGAQRDRPRAIAQGSFDARAPARVRPRRARPRRRAARPRADAANAGDARGDLRAHARRGPRRRDRLADQRARGVFERHAGDRRGCRKRRRDRRRDRGPRGRRGEDHTLEGLRLRDVVLVGEQRDRGRGRRRRASRGVRTRGRLPARRRGDATAGERDVPARQARA